MKVMVRFDPALTAVALILSFYVAPVFGQQDDSDVIRVTSRVVSVEALVTDKRTGARVDKLRKEDFELLDNGRRQELTHFSQGADPNRPLALALIVDVRHWGNAAVPGLRTTLQRALAQLKPEDKVAVFNFWQGAEMLQELTGDRALVLEALTASASRREQLGGKSGGDSGGSMIKALLAATRHLQEKQPKSRIALVVISDDMNATPRGEVADTTKQLLEAGVTVSGLVKVSGELARTIKGLGRAISAAKLTYRVSENLAHYSSQTGGQVVDVQGEDYSEALEQVIGNLVGRYSLGFVPDASRLDGKFHKLTLKVKLPPELGKGRKIVVSARRGYLARKDDKE
jgi:VWFA-related protein